MKQKKGFILGCLLVVLAGGSLQAFDIECGIKAGFHKVESVFSGNIRYMTFEPLKKNGGGAFLNVRFFNGMVGLQPEIHYTYRGFVALETDRGESITSTYTISYVEIPVLLVVEVPFFKGKLRPGILLGPYFGYAGKATERIDAFGSVEENDLGDHFKGNDFGYVYGGYLKYNLGFLNFSLGLRWSRGTRNICRNIEEVSYDLYADDTLKNESVSVMVGLSFNIVQSRRK
jgi:hypothetical protein